MTWIDTLKRIGRDDRVLARARIRSAKIVLVLLLMAVAFWIIFRPFRGEEALLNVAYEASRGYFEEVDRTFPQFSDGMVESVRSSYAGSLRQLEAVARGLIADTVFLATPAELDELAADDLVAADWRSQWPHGASPCYSTIVFIVPAGNPKSIHGWSDLSRPEVTLSVPSPLVSGAGAYAFLGLIQEAQLRQGENPIAIRQTVTEIYQRACILERGAQQALYIFLREKNGDVFATWESEALRLSSSGAGNRFEIVYPVRSILAEPVVAVLIPHVDRRGSESGARAYLDFLFSPEGQRIAASHGLRPRISEDASGFPPLELVSVQATFGSWAEAWEQYLGPGGTYAWIERIRSARAGGIE